VFSLFYRANNAFWFYENSLHLVTTPTDCWYRSAAAPDSRSLKGDIHVGHQHQHQFAQRPAKPGGQR
jgi:hypothetical protein